ncbi:Nuclear RNA export factor [Nesidiocoris tenuis]|uniref:Nuclear RNA export factor n=1 Tax=Nesidiocoris tenuis TaxID=355587 RepID=A0ABN7ALG6_9HEMI|nr:Nuclear RNA export factor [Nesidiocoris tenuis]
MPNKNFKRNRLRRPKSYNDHDDRMAGPHMDSRRVSFKNQGRDQRNRHQGPWDKKKLRALLLQNDDIDMGGSAGERERFNRGGGDQRHDNFRGSREDRKKWKKRVKFMMGGYYRIEVWRGSKYGKTELLKLLGSYIKPTPLVPLEVKSDGQDFIFSVENFEVAEKLQSADNKMTLSDGFRLKLQVRAYVPNIELNEKLMTTMKAALAARYNVATKALDLTHFQSDQVLTSQELLCALNRPNVMSCIIELIAECVPDLVALSLNKNNLSAVEPLKAMIDKLPHLKILHMAKNNIKDVKQLDNLSGLKLEEVNLDGNPLVAKFQNLPQEDYVRAIRQRFPRVIKLDGVDLPKPIIFDLEDDEVLTLPKSQFSFICDPGQGNVMAKTFIEQYYQIFDSGDRTPLLQAYHDNAHFSLSCFISAQDSHSMFTSYMSENRNLKRVTHEERRLKLLKIGKPAIVDYFKNFPQTVHDPATFVVDLVFFTPELIQLVVGGLYREKDKFNEGSPIKYFNRSFIIVPVGAGFCIVNEELTLLYPTPAQIKLMSSKLKDLTDSGPSSAALAGPSVPAQAATNGLDNDILAKQRLVTELAAKTQMNLAWSEKCLVETNWNAEQAMFAFCQLRDTGKIPPEAFQK